MRVELPASPVLVGVSEADLAACLDALLGNVFAHTPEGTAFTVGLRPRAAGGGQVRVEDRGPGFTETDPVRRGTSGGGSTAWAWTSPGRSPRRPAARSPSPT